MERSGLSIGGGYKNTLTRRCFGFGPDTRQGDKTSYSDQGFAAGVGYSDAFAEAGDDFVYHLGDFGSAGVTSSHGLNFRMARESTTRLRIDLGVCSEDFLVTVAHGLNF